VLFYDLKSIDPYRWGGQNGSKIIPATFFHFTTRTPTRSKSFHDGPSKRKFPSVPTAVVQRQTVKLEVRTAGFKSNKSQWNECFIHETLIFKQWNTSDSDHCLVSIPQPKFRWYKKYFCLFNGPRSLFPIPFYFHVNGLETVKFAGRVSCRNN
jgi:hypothetical protein